MRKTFPLPRIFFFFFNTENRMSKLKMYKPASELSLERHVRYFNTFLVTDIELKCCSGDRMEKIISSIYARKPVD